MSVSSLNRFHRTLPPLAHARLAAQFLARSVGINQREWLRVTIGVALGVLLSALLGRWWWHAGGGGHYWMVASLGASAVLVFGMPSSPCRSHGRCWEEMPCRYWWAWPAALVPDPSIAAALAVSLAVLVMVPLRCLHPGRPWPVCRCSTPKKVRGWRLFP